MDNRIETEYVIKIEEALKSLKAVDERLGTIEDLTNRAGNNQSFATLGKTVNQYNRVLADGSKIYRQVESNAKAYKSEIERLTKAEKELIKAQIEFKNGADYDEAEQNLIQVRKRIEEIKAGLDKTGDTAKKSGGIFSSLGNIAKTALAGAVAFFTVDKLVDVEGQIIDATRTYEKYFAVLRNGFQDENKASESLELIYKFASATPFSVNELTESFIKLNGRGFTPTEVEMRKLGDLASSQGKQFEQLTEAILDATTNEYERLKEFGINATTVGNKVTLSFKDQETTINKFNKGAIKDAILAFGELKGVAGSMGAVSVTLEGQISNLGDSWEQLLTSLGKSQGFLSGVIGTTKSLIDTLKGWVDVPVEQKIRGEQVELNSLVKSLILAGDNEDLVGQIRAEIAQKYPSFLKLIDLEKSTNVSLANALNLVNIEYENKIKLAGLDLIAQKNAGNKAKLIQNEGDALQKLIPLIEKAGITESKFLALNKKQQEAVIKSQIEKQFPQDKILQSGVSKGRYESNQALNTFISFDKKYKDEENSRRGVDALVKKQGADILTNRQEEINKIKTQNEELKKKGILTQKQLDLEIKLGAKGTVSKDKIENSKTFYSNESIIGKGVEKYLSTEFNAPAKPVKTQSDSTEDKPQTKQRLEEIDKLKLEEKKYQKELYSITLEAENVRLSLMDKESQKYLDEKLAYDQKVINLEEEKYKELYQIQLENEIIQDELQKRKGEKILDSELENIRTKSKIEAERIANDKSNVRNFDNTAVTDPQREIIDAKRGSVVVAYYEGLEKIEEKGIKEQQERLDLQNSLLGEGIEKQIQTINEKYKRLIEKYKENQEIVKQLESKRNLELLDLNLENSNKSEDTSTNLKKNSVENRKQPAGTNKIEFEINQKADLIGLDIKFFKRKIELLEEYLSTESYMQALANGQISEEQKKTNIEKLKELKQAFNSSIFESKNFTDKNLLTIQKYQSGWDIIGGVYEKIAGKTLKLTEDPEIDKALKESVANSLNSLKDSFSQMQQMQIDASESRIKSLDDEIGIREQKLNEEHERYKQGLSNSFQDEKETLEKKKEERQKEIDHKKKLQKQQAIVDNLSIIGSNAVTVASTIEASAKAFKAHSGIPFVGIALGLAAVATIIATVASVSAKTKQSSRLRYGGKIKGNLHEVNDGIEVGSTGIFVEGGEYVNRREIVGKSPKFFDTINDGSFERLDSLNQRKLLKPFGLKITESRNEDAKLNVDNLKVYKTAKEKQSMTDYHYKKMAMSLGAVAENTSRIPEYQIVSDSDGNIFKFDSKGKIVERIEK